MASRLDREALRRELKSACSIAFHALRTAHPEERFYAFALYTDDAASYLGPTANSEEALLRSARDGSAADLRWSPCDWTYHLDGEEHFQEVGRILGAADPYSEDLTQDEFEAQVEVVLEVALTVLRELDAEGAFGRDAARAAAIVGIMMGDQSDEDRLFWATALNSPDAVRRLAGELTAG